MDGEPVSNHEELMSNFFAQPDALATGKNLQELEEQGVPAHLQGHKLFSGDRPSLSILFSGSLTPFNCGQLLALYEHRVAVEGFIYGINSFDQWGVELGKVLAKEVRTVFTAKQAGSDVKLDGFNPSTKHLLSEYLADM
jgi:glucose-6-phosphate isomerase